MYTSLISFAACFQFSSFPSRPLEHHLGHVWKSGHEVPGWAALWVDCEYLHLFHYNACTQYAFYQQAVIACAGFSLLAIQFVWIRLVWSSLKGRNPAKVSKFMPEHVFFRTQLGAYIASLLWSNAISCIGYVMNVVWLMDGAVTSGESPSSRPPVSAVMLIGVTGSKAIFALPKVRGSRRCRMIHS